MFGKCLIVFSLLAAFSVQGMETIQLDALPVESTALSDLVKQVKELSKKLNDIVSGDLANAMETFKDAIETIKASKEKFLNQGLGAVSAGFKKTINFIASKTEEADELDINIAKCTSGKHEQLLQLATGLSGRLTQCVSESVTESIEKISNVLQVSDDTIKNVANLPVELSKCMISSNPNTCVRDMVTTLTEAVNKMPGQIAQLTAEVSTFVESLPEKLGSCSNGISDNFNSKVDAMIDEVSKCVDKLMPAQIFRF